MRYVGAVLPRTNPYMGIVIQTSGVSKVSLSYKFGSHGEVILYLTQPETEELIRHLTACVNTLKLAVKGDKS